MVKIKTDEFTKLVKEIYEERTEEKIDLKEAKPFIEDVIFAIEVALLDGYEVPLGKLGHLQVKERAARKGLNPTLLKELKEQGLSVEDAKRKAEIDIEASKNVGFKIGKHLKEKLNNK